MAQSVDVATRAVTGDLTVGIIGLGYVGLPTSIGFHDAGFNVWGVDVSQRTVDMVRAGENPTGDPDVDDIVPAPGTERWNITTSTAEAVPHCDVVLVTVPTPITHDLKPDLSYVEAAGRAVFEAIPKGSNTVVVLESTVYPGVTAQTWSSERKRSDWSGSARRSWPVALIGPQTVKRVCANDCRPPRCACDWPR